MLRLSATSAVAAKVLRYSMGAARVLASNVRRLRSPLKLTFALTYWCQYRCTTCNIWQRKPVDELSTDEIFRFIDLNRDVSWLDLTGGEIFLRKDIDDILERFVRTWRQLVILHFPTNGFLTDSIVAAVERIARLSPVRIIVTVSIDGDEPLNDRLRGVKGGYRRQIETFRALRHIRGVQPVFGMTLSSGNVGGFERTFRACQRDVEDLTIDDFHLNVAQVSAHYYGNEGRQGVLVDPDAARRELRVYRSMRGVPTSLAAWIESRYLRHLDDYLASGRTPMPCHSLRSSCFIDPWGTVYPCISYDRPIGSLRDSGLRLGPIWESAEARQRQAEIWRGDCPQCWTACEAYPTLLGHLLRPHGAERPKRGTGLLCTDRPM